MNVKIIKDKNLKELPGYATDGAAAVDLVANIEKAIELRPGETVAIPTGIRLDMTAEPGLCALVLPRSGLGSKGLVLANTVGLIDNDYQGEITVMAMNRNPTVEKKGMGIVQNAASIAITPGMRIAQLMFTRYERVTFAVVEDFEARTRRGKGGFGSTGA